MCLHIFYLYMHIGRGIPARNEKGECLDILLTLLRSHRNIDMMRFVQNSSFKT